MTKRSIVKMNQSEQSIEQVDVPVQPQPVKPLSNRQKARLMADLDSALDNESVVKAITSLPNGNAIYGIFEAAMEKEIGKLMGNSSGVDESELGNMAEASNQIKDMLGVAYNFLQSMRTNEMMTLLKIVATKVGVQPQPLNQPPPQQYQQQQPPQQYQPQQAQVRQKLENIDFTNNPPIQGLW